MMTLKNTRSAKGSSGSRGNDVCGNIITLKLK